MIGQERCSFPPCRVIILAGGRSSRMGKDKAQVKVNGHRLIDLCLEQVSPLCSTPVVVSSVDLQLPQEITQVTENPPFGGPVAGIAAGFYERPDFSARNDAFTAVIAADAPLSGGFLPQLLEVLMKAPQAGVAHATIEEHTQPLLAVWRNNALHAALKSLDSPHHVAAKKLLHRCPSSVLAVVVDQCAQDYDTPEELATLGHVSLN
ncbi:hypothetical protein A4R63_01955 [Corynebacterium pseudotuberculosis]|uniref:molybdenum cofactor guanylyltransferase n=1 Tax=Corynebacterium pseudotuberculosis TaxID=1719 RepID=UPI00065E9B79|nr:molybdenum cofactor guanylyltransferase [Corynebacterium pseudotuberculosis]APB10344.1 hypothetical protein A4R72_02160 [Corynebacterium pseudotuberculosis]APB12392.1 hypothetical protein A4R71_02175 [Corynebacterium pseudotuberculosis]APB14438.1 hypothetical protein A4R68_02170 [Corynebacterium pseudotuberculosis]APB16484.1 hypothetical protein A4R67_02165 [Corynebacterium pseudotuberculosis]APB18533.1 hypothetical protein A4R66_02170 [Corynebacterium pseudotuberculosis]